MALPLKPRCITSYLESTVDRTVFVEHHTHLVRLNFSHLKPYFFADSGRVISRFLGCFGIPRIPASMIAGGIREAAWLRRAERARLAKIEVLLRLRVDHFSSLSKGAGLMAGKRK